MHYVFIFTLGLNKGKLYLHNITMENWHTIQNKKLIEMCNSLERKIFNLSK